jgi:formamidopyrimidine-DNA glycosylase
MIELPEGLVLAQQVDGALRGKKLLHVTAASSPHKFAWYHGDPTTYDDLFSGSVLEGAYSYGGKLHIKLSGDGGFMFCDGVNLRYYTEQKEIPKKHQLLIEFDDGTYLVGTVQMYGGIYGYRGVLDHEYDEIARLKPPVLSDDFNMAYFKALVSGALKPKRSAKAFLATEQRIPGLGNGVVQDVLFNAGISPKRDMVTLTPTEIDALFVSIKTTIADMVIKGGRNVEKDLYGKPGGYATIMSKDTYMFPCPSCGGAVKKEAYMGGSVYFCPACQK